MQLDPLALATILGMALVTYGTRVGGLWLLGRVTPSRRVEAWLRNIPGAVLVAIVTPDALTHGPADILAAAATALIAFRTRNFLLAIVVGVLSAWVLRQILN
jgi:branched chain amino acid efflux pump